MTRSHLPFLYIIDCKNRGLLKRQQAYHIPFLYALILIKMEDYKKYLEIIDEYLAKFFEQQKDYIFCKEGCSVCCENGSYPFSQLEFDYLMYGFKKLPQELKSQIMNEINQLKEERNILRKEISICAPPHPNPYLSPNDTQSFGSAGSQGEREQKQNPKKFFHKCPFLIDKKCSVYQYRALICRNYGLMYYYKNNEGEQRYHMPCCVHQGLNYSNVYDEKEGTLTTEKWQASGIEVEPVSYNVSLAFLMDNNLTKFLELEFGTQKHILDWFIDSSYD